MSKLSENDIAWEKLFSKYGILSQVESMGKYEISAEEIKEFREPRLMAKFDHSADLPKIFSSNQLAILPLSRRKYVISHFEAYHRFENKSTPVIKMSLPTYLQSLDADSISSETIAINCAVAAGIIEDFLNDERLVSTISGRMGSGRFAFDIKSLRINSPYRVQVDNSQIEIDAAYEGVKTVALIEAKRSVSEDFLVRQLYYPFRAWHNRSVNPIVTKCIRPLFLIYSNSIYRLYEYRFQDPENYNSLVLVNQKNYSIEDTNIELIEVQSVLEESVIKEEPDVPFPQADSFDRVINICELLNEQPLCRDCLTEQYAFAERQTSYYTDAARYLGLVRKGESETGVWYKLSDVGQRILGLKYKERQLAYCRLILSHRVFNDTLRSCLKTSRMPSNNEIVQIMKRSSLYRINGEKTFRRRSSTVRSWINWILGLLSE